MNKTVQILIFMALLPMLGTAREETMEERKKRVTRKYLRERTNIAQSDMVVPEALAEDLQVTDSEKFQGVEINLQRQESGTMPMPPPRRRPVPLQENSNWLLTESEFEDDPYADPFDMQNTESQDDYWAMWGGKPDDGEYGSSRKESTRREAVYDPYSSRENAYDSRTQGTVDPRSEQGLFKSGAQFGDRSEPSAYTSRTSIFGRQPEQSTTGGLGTQGVRTYGSSPDNGLLASPFSRTSREVDPNRSRGAEGYTPYKSSYETDREKRQQQWGGKVVEPRKEYQKPSSHQQWKDRNKGWDPTKDDAYLDELMEKNRR